MPRYTRTLTPAAGTDAATVDALTAKAARAYAEWRKALRANGSQYPRGAAYGATLARGEALHAEYKATVERIAPLVREDVVTVCAVVMVRAMHDPDYY